MRIVTMTSDNYVPCTRMMIESIRVWHPQVPVIVYALSTGWKQEHQDVFDGLNARVKLLEEVDVRNRRGANGEAIFNLQKLDVMLDQAEPFLMLDSDILILKPLDTVFADIDRDGWFTAHENTRLRDYYRGDITKVVELSGPGLDQTSINSGVLGCDPAKHRRVFELARAWAKQIGGIFLGDQGLVNLAWFKLYGDAPPQVSYLYNGGFTTEGRVDLRQTILHFGRSHTKLGGKQKVQTDIWAAWPKGVELLNLADTDFWKSTLPHPWEWLNQANKKVHRGFVRRVREQSRCLIGTSWLIVQNDDEAYLLHSDVLDALNAFWRKEHRRLNGVPHLATFNLDPSNQPTPRWRKMIQRTCREAASLIR
jgi:hypothetical protein